MPIGRNASLWRSCLVKGGVCVSVGGRCVPGRGDRAAKSAPLGRGIHIARVGASGRRLGGAAVRQGGPRATFAEGAQGASYFAVGITNSAPLPMLSGQRCMIDFCLV
jgi:hypothetical protein